LSVLRQRGISAVNTNLSLKICLRTTPFLVNFGLVMGEVAYKSQEFSNQDGSGASGRFIRHRSWLGRITTLFPPREKYPGSSRLAAVPVSPSEHVLCARKFWLND
jgi:hypothetical protein